QCQDQGAHRRQVHGDRRRRAGRRIRRETRLSIRHQCVIALPPTTVDRVLHDGDHVTLGDATLVAHLTPGHTKGCTTWTMKVTEGAKTYDVVIVGSPNVNPGYKLVGNAHYPA